MWENYLAKTNFGCRVSVYSTNKLTIFLTEGFILLFFKLRVFFFFLVRSSSDNKMFVNTEGQEPTYTLKLRIPSWKNILM